MSRLLALPLTAAVIAILACGTSATEVIPNSAPATSPVQAPTDAPAADSGARSAPTPVPAVTSSLEPTPRPTPPPGPTVAAVLANSQTATSPPGTTSGPTIAQPRLAIIVDQPGLGTDVGKTLPNFEFTLFDGTRRNTAQLSSQGRPVLLFFFATW